LFAEQLKNLGLERELFDRFNEMLDACGFAVKSGLIVDGRRRMTFSISVPRITLWLTMRTSLFGIMMRRIGIFATKTALSKDEILTKIVRQSLIRHCSAVGDTCPIMGRKSVETRRL